MGSGAMRSSVRFGALVACGVLCCAPAYAGRFYFHKAAVARDAFTSDIALCNDLAGGARTPAQPYVPTTNAASAAAAAFFSGFFGGRERRGLVENILRTCMTDKGYRRVELPHHIGKALARMDAEARLDALFALASAESPEGAILPR